LLSLPALALLTLLAAPALAGPHGGPPLLEACPRGQPVPVLAPVPVLRTKPDRPLRILAIGSSSTEGAGASGPGATYPARLTADLAAMLGPDGVVVANAGRGGEKAVATLQRLAKRLSPAPDLVIWQVGVNDALDPSVPEAAFAGTLRDGIAMIRAAGAVPLLLDQQAFPTVPDPARYARFVAIVGDVAQAEGAALFPRHAIMAAWDAATLDSMLAPDRFHMADRGYDCLAGLIAAALLRQP
jgi:lysophospholipase L1-like esterase